jgi:hypothetical protein
VRALTPVAVLRFGGLSLFLGCLAAPGLAARMPQPRAAGPAASVTRDLVTRADAVRLREKVAAIEQQAALVPDSGARARRPTLRSTTLSEREVNSYLAFEAGSQIPVGIAQPRIAILGDRRLSATALVDLDAVRDHHKATGWFDPVTYLSGRLPVAVSGQLHTADGVARFDLEAATISSVPIPKALLQELVSYYSRSPQNPHGLNLDDSFLLPARIRQIDVRRGEAVVIQ